MRNSAFSFCFTLGVRAGQILLVILAVLSCVYIFICVRSFRSEQLAQPGAVDGLIRAARLAPGDATIRQRLALARLYQDNDPEAALSDFQQALQINPRDADSWIGTAYAYQLLGRLGEERAAISHALSVAPRRPEIAWQAANLYAVLGDRDLAMTQLCTIIAHDRAHSGAALDLASKVTRDKAMDCSHRGNAH